MNNPFHFKCPHCGETDSFNISTHHSLRIRGSEVSWCDQRPTDWEPDDIMTCQDCDYEDQVKAFQTEEDHE